MDGVSAAMVVEAFTDVQDKNTSTSWFILKYQGDLITLDSVGDDFEVFKTKFMESGPSVGYMELPLGDNQTGTCLIFWSGPEGKTSKQRNHHEDVENVKQLLEIKPFELTLNSPDELEYGNIIYRIVRYHTFKY